jgi:hypothetical protein
MLQDCPPEVTESLKGPCFFRRDWNGDEETAFFTARTVSRGCIAGGSFLGDNASVRTCSSRHESNGGHQK